MKNEKNMSTLIWEFFIHIAYVSCLMLLTNMLRGSDQFVWVDKMHASFNHKIHYQLNLNDFKTFWTWMDEVATASAAVWVCGARGPSTVRPAAALNDTHPPPRHRVDLRP